MTNLYAMTDTDFAWMLGEADRSDGLTLCEGGIAPEAVTVMLRGVATAVAATTTRPVAWMIVEQDIVIGMISLTKLNSDQRYEIGYGMASAYQGRGVMTRAIAALLPIARADGHCGLTAETSVDNPASQQVLSANGFVQTGMRNDPEDGTLITWAIALDQTMATEMIA